MPSNSIDDDDFRTFMERIDRLEEEKKELADDIKDVFTEMKSTGYDVKAVKEYRRQAKLDAQAREDRRMQVDAMLNAMGLL